MALSKKKLAYRRMYTISYTRIGHFPVGDGVRETEPHRFLFHGYTLNASSLACMTLYVRLH